MGHYQSGHSFSRQTDKLDKSERKRGKTNKDIAVKVKMEIVKLIKFDNRS